MLRRTPVLVVLLALASQPGKGDERTVEILMRDSVVMTGEILALRDTALVISLVSGAPEAFLISHREMTPVIPFRSIQRINSDGKSWTLPGFGIGFLGGLAIGGIIGANNVDKDNVAEVVATPISAGMTALLGGVIGGFLGLGIGAAASSPDIEYPETSIAMLRDCARYKEAEPQFLRERK